MKKILLGIFILFLGLSSVSAQDQYGRFSLAGNINYGTNIESLGIGLRGQYGFTDYIRGSMEYKYYIDRHNVSAWGNYCRCALCIWCLQHCFPLSDSGGGNSVEMDYRFWTK